MKMELKAVKSTWTADIYIAGDINQIERTCREYCMEVGLCVTITPTSFIYTGGKETGARVGLINYPRFPKTPSEINETAINLGQILAKECFQTSYSIVFPDQTLFFSNRKDN